MEPHEPHIWTPCPLPLPLPLPQLVLSLARLLSLSNNSKEKRHESTMPHTQGSTPTVQEGKQDAVANSPLSDELGSRRVPAVLPPPLTSHGQWGLSPGVVHMGHRERERRVMLWITGGLRGTKSFTFQMASPRGTPPSGVSPSNPPP